MPIFFVMPILAITIIFGIFDTVGIIWLINCAIVTPIFIYSTYSHRVINSVSEDSLFFQSLLIKYNGLINSPEFWENDPKYIAKCSRARKNIVWFLRMKVVVIDILKRYPTFFASFYMMHVTNFENSYHNQFPCKPGMFVYIEERLILTIIYNLKLDTSVKVTFDDEDPLKVVKFQIFNQDGSLKDTYYPNDNGKFIIDNNREKDERIILL